MAEAAHVGAFTEARADRDTAQVKTIYNRETPGQNANQRTKVGASLQAPARC